MVDKAKDNEQGTAQVVPGSSQFAYEAPRGEHPDVAKQLEKQPAVQTAEDALPQVDTSK